MSSNIHAHTPEVTVLDNRGLTVRTIGYHRHPETPDVTDERITRHQFDARGHLVTSIDPRLFARQQHDKTVKPNVSYLTNLTGDVIRTESPDAGITVSLSDIARRPHWSKNAVGALQTWQYEADTLPGRLLSVTEQPQGESARITERVVYAGHNENEKAHNLAGQAVRHYDTAGLTQTDSLALTGTPLAVTRQLPPEGTPADWQGTQESAWQTSLSADIFTTHSTADATGATLTRTDAKGHQQRLTYDVAGLLTESGLTLKGQPEQIILKSLTWSAAGQKLRESHGNGVVTTYRYEPETQRLTAIKTERPTGHAAGVKVLQDLRYTYDPVGNVLRILDEAEPTRFWRNQKVVPENTYTYDSLYQLVKATGREKADIKNQGISPTAVSIPLATDNTAYTTWTRSYTYDNGNNLTRIRHHAPASGNTYTTEITVSHRSNRAVLSLLTKDPAQVDSLFDAGGHQTQLQKGQPITWTARGELLKVMPVVRDEQADDAETYRYDATSQRVIKTTVQQTGNSRQTQRVVYLPNLELRTTHRGEKLKEALQVITVGEAGRAQVRVLHWEAGKPDGLNNNQLRYSYDNLIGSSTLELDGKGEIISLEEYYPYGGTAVWTARNQTEADYKTRRYSGKERDTTGLYYYGYRYYQPWVGRWLSSDPAGTVDGLNLFKMSGNNPITMHDKKGLSPDKYNMYSMKEETTRIFRVEVKNFNPRFGHVFIENSNARIYFPEKISMGALSNPEIKLSTYYTGKLTSDIGVSLSYTSITESNIVKIYFHEPYISLFDKKGMSDYEYSRGYLTMNDKAPLGTMGWLNFNNPNRALKLYEQKKNNPNEKEEFVIKSFDIPSGVFKAISETAILEEERKDNKSKPLNVDIKSTNQFGLQTTHLSLINKFSIPGTGKTYSSKKEIDAFKKEYEQWNKFSEKMVKKKTLKKYELNSNYNPTKPPRLNKITVINERF